jgi:CRP/FNR family cyclic AMP-dependent transcriptional regulator
MERGASGDPLKAGFLGSLPEAAATELMDEALHLEVPTGREVYQADDQPRVLVVLDGLLRLYIGSYDGREVTIRYARRGDVLGLALVLGGPAPVSIQALTDASVMALRITVLRRLIGSDPAVARACAAELARQLVEAFEEIGDQAFLTVRQRVARRLLDLAEHRRDGNLAARVTQQELADAVGSTREVVARAIRDLRRAGLVGTSRAGIPVLDPLGLREDAMGAPRAAPE